MSDPRSELDRLLELKGICDWKYTEEIYTEYNSLKAKIESQLEDGEKWKRLNSAFRDPVDWSKIEYLAVSEMNKENPHVAHLDTEYQELKEQILQKYKESKE